MAAFLDCECDEVTPLLLEWESNVGRVAEEGQGALSSLIPLWPGEWADLVGHGGCNFG